MHLLRSKERARVVVVVLLLLSTSLPSWTATRSRASFSPRSNAHTCSGRHGTAWTRRTSRTLARVVRRRAHMQASCDDGRTRRSAPPIPRKNRKKRFGVFSTPFLWGGEEKERAMGEEARERVASPQAEEGVRRFERCDGNDGWRRCVTRPRAVQGWQGIRGTRWSRYESKNRTT